MYGESFGTGTLARSLMEVSRQLYCDMDDGVPSSELVVEARLLMEGSIILWGSMLLEAQEETG